ncbi:hypothetical protein B0T21DRAFT_175680 [Apiosordaria backusii]|uniref:FAD-binding domain-containing protein n=1 Tax=Apiosordaria backusii TaxID=314023 RepID=A0AA40BL46_9PEZI|nr:hypothetical protein B0T21DRAFT_175680 [Apiosordaria backusii]
MSPISDISVIIVGGGPVGLTAAHAFSQLGIDFTLLERRDTIAEDVGASIVLWPHGMRIMAQLGLLDQLLSIGTELLSGAYQTKNGKIFLKTKSPQLCKTNHGIYPQCFARADLISVLFNTLPPSAKSKIHTSKAVTSISLLDAASGGGVKVLCSDNTSHTATFIIGADGIHSIVRKTILESLSPPPPPPPPPPPSNPTTSSSSSSKPPIPSPTKPQLLKTRYSLLWFSLPRTTLLTSIPATSAFEVHSKDLTLQLLANDKSNVQFCFIYQLLPSDYDPSKRYTEKDIEQIIASPKVAALPLGQSGLTVKDVWPLRQKFGMTPLEEGVLEPEWSYKNQMVVVGDAAHKVTPTTGQGLNMGLLDVVSLANHVSELVASTSNKDMFLSGLEEAFRKYREERIDSVREEAKRCGLVTRIAGWRDWRFKFFDRVVMPIPGVDVLLVNKVNSPSMAKCLVFRGIKVKREPFEGGLEWKEKMPLLEKGERDEKGKDSGEEST